MERPLYEGPATILDFRQWLNDQADLPTEVNMDRGLRDQFCQTLLSQPGFPNYVQEEDYLLWDGIKIYGV